MTKTRKSILYNYNASFYGTIRSFIFAFFSGTKYQPTNPRAGTKTLQTKNETHKHQKYHRKKCGQLHFQISTVSFCLHQKKKKKETMNQRKKKTKISRKTVTQMHIFDAAPIVNCSLFHGLSLLLLRIFSFLLLFITMNTRLLLVVISFIFQPFFFRSSLCSTISECTLITFLFAFWYYFSTTLLS